ncbi:MAG: flagellar assembly protein FliW [Thermotogae bacterium]|nr:flagellar assembly protein FliW [Thermotogota bacterium]
MEKVLTKIGELEIDEEKVVRFEKGIPGFENLRDFIVVEKEESYPILWLVSLDSPNVAIPVIDPWLIRVDYTVDIDEETVKELEIEGMEDLRILAVLVIPVGNPKDMTINLMAPIVINKRTGKGKQIIMENSGYGIRHKVVDEIERSKKIMKDMNENTG